MVSRVSVIGASGYSGAELLFLLKRHPEVQLSCLVSGSSSGLHPSELYSSLWNDPDIPNFVQIDDVDFSDCDVVFLCMPNGKSSDFVRMIPKRLRIIDISADFRIKDLATYEEVYGKHFSPQLIDSFVPGLPEFYREELKGAHHIACPGCYATASMLALLPLAASGRIDISSVIIDAKSGMSGAGRAASLNGMFCELHNTFKAYSLKSPHRHVLEIKQQIKNVSRGRIQPKVQLTTQLLPINRGLMCSIYLPGDSDEIFSILNDYYKDSEFVFVDNDKSGDIRSVIGTNKCCLGVFDSGSGGTLVLSVIDNLLKGASGQAVQCFNISNGFHEQAGLQERNGCV